jgi:hypothetical protein
MTGTTMYCTSFDTTILVTSFGRSITAGLTKSMAMLDGGVMLHDPFANNMTLHMPQNSRSFSDEHVKHHWLRGLLFPFADCSAATAAIS